MIANNTGDALGDVYFQIEGLIGSALNDTLAGDAFANRLVGGSGVDNLSGLAAIDSLEGGAGADLLYGGTEADQLFGGTEGDNLWGGAGADSHVGGDGAGVDYARYDDANYGNLVISLATPSSNTGAAAGDTYSGIEGLVGGAGNDTVSGDGLANFLFGSGGGDLVYGGAGNDYLSGDAGGDTSGAGPGLTSISVARMPASTMRATMMRTTAT